MPVIVIGADTPLGATVIDALTAPGREVRAFVTDGAAADRLRASGIRVAVGDFADGSHISAAALGCFSAVLLAPAADSSPPEDDVLAVWARSVTAAEIDRAIWVGCRPAGAAPETAAVSIEGRSLQEIAGEVADLDERAVL
jgi:uncharacterized protein YbjT (DUF2867 family)